MMNAEVLVELVVFLLESLHHLHYLMFEFLLFQKLVLDDDDDDDDDVLFSDHLNV
jgi:hypothetical protein